MTNLLLDMTMPLDGLISEPNGEAKSLGVAGWGL